MQSWREETAKAIIDQNLLKLPSQFRLRSRKTCTEHDPPTQFRRPRAIRSLPGSSNGHTGPQLPGIGSLDFAVGFLFVLA